jgi:hypothetical protein
MIRAYLKLHLWLKARCERLTLRQRKIFLYSVSGVYFICCIGLIMPLFIPEKDAGKTHKENIPELIDTPIQKDSLYRCETFEQATT